MERQHFDIGLVIPLKEEFRYVIEITAVLGSISHEGTYFYRLDFGAISAVACLVGQMGPIPALQATTRLLEFADIKLLALLGVAGALDGDIAIGDVVVASEVNEFQANSKAESTGDGYEVRYSGRHWPLAYRIREAIGHFEFSGGDGFTSWRTRAELDYAALMIPDKETVCPSTSCVHVGPLASGTVVAASNAFIEEIKRIDRKFVAIDMEAAGVAPAAAERIHPLPCLVVRGISDRANEDKSALDAQGQGAWRRYCVRNATSFLRNLLSWQGFLDATGLSPSTQLKPSPDWAAQLAKRLQSRTGGPWIVGAAFGAYSHGPSFDGTAPVPMDLNRLRVTDSGISALLDAAERAKENLLASEDLDAAIAKFESLLDGFQAELRPATSSLLQDFDRVVMEIIAPPGEDEQDQALLLEADRLEEDIGPKAVIELLAGVPHQKPRLRERYVGALARAEMWPQIIATTNNVDVADLSRGEFEHLIFACTKIGSTGRAEELLQQHQLAFVDKAARLFRRSMSSNFAFDAKESEGKDD